MASFEPPEAVLYHTPKQQNMNRTADKDAQVVGGRSRDHPGAGAGLVVTPVGASHQGWSDQRTNDGPVGDSDKHVDEICTSNHKEKALVAFQRICKHGAASGMGPQQWDHPQRSECRLRCMNSPCISR